MVFTRQAADLPAYDSQAYQRRAQTLSQQDSGWLDAQGVGPVEDYWVMNSARVRVSAEELERLASSGRVESIVDDRAAVRATALQPAQTAPPTSWALQRIGSLGAPASAPLGQGITVGVIDTGIAPGHPALAGKIAGWRDTVGGNPTPHDVHGHGTAVASFIVGGSSGSWSRLGVAPEARLLVAKGLDDAGAGNAGPLLAAAQWMADPDGNPATADQPVAVNNSWASSVPNQPWLQTMIRAWRSLGIIPVFAAGNEGPAEATISSPADYPESFTVGSVDEDDRVSSFSSRGPVIWAPPGEVPVALSKPEILAPGGLVPGASAKGGVAFWSGTSVSAPLVAGAFAIIAQQTPGATVDQRIAILRSAARIGQDGLPRLTVPLASMTPAPPATPAPPTFIAPGKGFKKFHRTAVVRIPVSLGSFPAYTVYVNGQLRGLPRTSATASVALRPGRHRIELRSVDVAGAEVSQTTRRFVVIDRTKPNGRVISKATGARVVLTLRATDKGGAGIDRASVRWTAKGLTKTQRTGRLRITLSDSSSPRPVKVSFRDRAGNLRVLAGRLVDGRLIIRR
ncbi:S8 family serine peptidase [Miltoncostaea oceani]|uniref:S8 family serine peptidase n=1 Tax=Miltoncostaea oceani TaxID=2843216 RepID=UPI001C3E4C7E|nr:S8 family serine peptidase [Miltoncostaea oceani]